MGISTLRASYVHLLNVVHGTAMIQVEHLIEGFLEVLCVWIFLNIVNDGNNTCNLAEFILRYV